jgi:GT2 family glycosyltransferase
MNENDNTFEHPLSGGHPCDTGIDGNRVGIIVIGRNEGERLRRAFTSLPLKDVPVLYVDSGSTDGSIELAHTLSVHVHCLDPAQPFSPARARGEGISRLLQIAPDIRFVQFLDGDCELSPDWLTQAVAYLEQHPEVAIVCGLLAETAPEQSLYNRLSPQNWKLSVGEITACGGVFMIRRECYEEVGGFNPTLITREERELCARIRSASYRVVRLDTLMAKHDSSLLTFCQWWTRAVWGGYGDALSIAVNPNNCESRQRLLRYMLGPLATIILIVVGLIGLLLWSVWFGLAWLLAMLIQGQQFARIAIARLREGDTFPYAVLFAAFFTLRNFATCFGFIQFFVGQIKQTNRPDPHTP